MCVFIGLKKREKKTLGKANINAGTYSCLQVNLVFAKELSFYILTIYTPCFMIVLVSWFSFWIDYKAVSIYNLYNVWY